MTIPCPHNGVHEPGREPIYCLRQKLDQAEAALARVVDAATSAKDYLKPELDEPGRSVFWGLVGALKEARTPTLSRAADRIRAEAFEEAARLAENCDGNNVTLLDLSLALRKQAISLRQEAGGEGDGRADGL